MPPSSSGPGQVDVSTESGMICTYILECSDKTYYVGSTNDFERRLLEHNGGLSKYTRKKLPLKLVFKREFTNLKEARKFEYFIKKQRNKKFYQKLIKGGFV